MIYVGGRVLSGRPGFGGEIASIWGADDGGLGAVSPAGYRGRAPGQGVSGAKPPRSWELFAV